MIGQGVPEEILTEELLEEIYGVRLPVFTVEKKTVYIGGVRFA